MTVFETRVLLEMLMIAVVLRLAKGEALDPDHFLVGKSAWK